MKLQSIANTTDLQKRIAGTQRLVEKSMGIVHRFACDLRPTVLDNMGLIPSLVSHLKIFSKRTAIPVEFTAFADVEKLDGSVRTVLYRIAQEALSNIGRHSQATRTQVSLIQRPDAVVMEITDNGMGFWLEGVFSAGDGNCLGLLGMRERMEMMGGSFAVDSLPGAGTTVRVEIPKPLAGKTRKRVAKKTNKNHST